MCRVSPAVDDCSRCRISGRYRFGLDSSPKSDPLRPQPSRSCLGAVTGARCSPSTRSSLSVDSGTTNAPPAFCRDDGACDALSMWVAGRSRVGDHRRHPPTVPRSAPRILLRRSSLPARCLATLENAGR